MDILFWDIDGTLLNTGKAGLYALEEAFAKLQGRTVAMPKIDAGGRTDNFICQQLLLKATGKLPDDDEVSAFCRCYEELLMKWIKKTEGTVVYPVREILPFFDARSGVKQLLLTGNSVYGARLKLDAYKLSCYFDFEHSGFARNFYYRNDIARHALQQVKQAWGNDVRNIFVIGDTPYDIQCGKAIGAKTIAVGTGRYSLEKLQTYEPWWLIAELPQPEEILKKLQSV